MTTSNRVVDVLFVGSMQQDNLALGYLVSAVRQAGHNADIVRYDTGKDHDRCLTELLDRSPDLIGFGMPFQYAVMDNLRLADSLRRAGNQSHITCGGHVPTFCYRELLRDCASLDTVVRHEGEDTVVDMVRKMSREEPVRDISGLVWRNEEGIEIGEPREDPTDLDALPVPHRPAQAMAIGGVPVGFLLTSRGCAGDCAYCCIRAFNRDMGGAPLRLRNSSSVADEVAFLYHERKARFFFVQDDLFILRNEEKALRRIGDLTTEIKQRGVTDAHFWIKGRPECITDDILLAAKKMGAIHIFLGIESASDDRLAYLGRTHRAADNRRALGLCRKHGIRPSFNFMLFDPDCTMDDIRSTVALAEENLDMPWNICRTEIYSGTRLKERLHEEGRLRGDYRNYGYTMTDKSAEVAFRIMRVSLHERAFTFDSLLNKLIGLSFCRQVHETMVGGRASDAINAQVNRLEIEAHQDTVDEMRRILDMASSVDPCDTKKTRSFATETAFEVNLRDVSRYERLTQLWDTITLSGELAFRRMVNGDVAKDRNVSGGKRI